MVTSAYRVKATAVQPAPSGDAPSRMSQGGSDHPRGNPLPALHGIFTLRAAEVALGQDKVQSGVSRQKLVKGQGRQARAPNPELGSWLVRVAMARSRAQAGALGRLSGNRVTRVLCDLGPQVLGERGAGAAAGPGPGSLARPPVLCVRAGSGWAGAGALGGRHRKSPRHPHPVPRPCRPPRPRAPAPAATTAAAAFAFAFATVAAGLSRPRRQLCGLNPSRPGHSPGPPPPGGRCGWGWGQDACVPGPAGAGRSARCNASPGAVRVSVRHGWRLSLRLYGWKRKGLPSQHPHCPLKRRRGFRAPLPGRGYKLGLIGT